MKNYTDFDDLGLYLSFIKSVSVDYSDHSVTISIAKPYDYKEKCLRYVEGQLVMRDVREMRFQQNLNDSEVPEFYRSAILDTHPEFELKAGENVFFFGVDWGSDYYKWYFIARSCAFVEESGPKLGEKLQWVM